MANTNITPPRAWTARLKQPFDATPTVELDPIERDAVDNAVPFAAEHARRTRADLADSHRALPDVRGLSSEHVARDSAR